MIDALERRNRPRNTMTPSQITARVNPRGAPGNTAKVEARSQTDIAGNPNRRNTMNRTRMIGENHMRLRREHPRGMTIASQNLIVGKRRARSPQRNTTSPIPQNRHLHVDKVMHQTRQKISRRGAIIRRAEVIQVIRSLPTICMLSQVNTCNRRQLDLLKQDT
jgi:hypothetical protein